MKIQSYKTFSSFKKSLKKILFVAKALLASRLSNYNFTINDIGLHFKELSASLPEYIVTSSEDSDTKIIKIKNSIIHFPVHIDHTDLPWLWHEVFDSYSENPSSYDHPNIIYNSLEWVIDAGASEGYFSLFCSKRLNPSSRIFALEPLPIMKNSLERTFKSNKLENAIVVASAIGSNDTELLIEQDLAHICDSKIKVKQPDLINANDEQMTFKTTPVQCVALDTLMKQYALHKNGLIKMDIEGFEMNALQGAHLLLKKYKPFLAVAVYHEYENALKCAEIIKNANPAYTIEYRGYYDYFKPPRPYILFAY